MYRGKRLLDVVLSIPVLVVLSPVMLVCAALVIASSPGPAIYAGERVGRFERPFRQMKFRTMVVGADLGGYQTADADPRITRVGRFLRRTSLDELPQLINVLRGEMSLVGPRPAAIPQLTLYTPDERRERAKVRPGITGLAQVSGRSSLTVEQSIAHDLEYARNASVRLDLDILGRTLSAVARRSGTN
jgi:lipopolysaccharide/colanic/teichoic acid biosynthesis glycosyltransferase